MGNDAGRAVTTGDSNVLIGSNAGDALTTSGSVVAIGKDACGQGTNNCNQSVCIGGDAGAQMN